MAKIIGIDGMSGSQLSWELENGGKFVVFEYCFSILIMTFKRGSDIYFIKKDDGTFGKSIGYTLVTFFLGWWGIPWGPIYSFGALATNLGGGKDVTAEVLQALTAEQG